MMPIILLQPAAAAPRSKRAQGDIDLSSEPVISIIDDDPFVRDGIGDLVASLGYQISDAVSDERVIVDD